MDEKQMRGEATHNITEGEKAAWQRSKGDAQRNDKLAQTDIPVSRVLKIVELYSEFGDDNRVAMRLDLEVRDVRRILSRFNVKSIEDARKLLKSGVVGDAIEEIQQEIQDSTLEAQQSAQDAAEAYETHQAEFDAPTKESASESLLERQKQAQELNKQDQVRQILHQGIKRRDPNAWQIPLDRVNEFKGKIRYGVSHLQRQFGGSKKEIVAEIRRLAPETDTDMLRP